MLTMKLFTTDFRLLHKYVEGEIELPTQDLMDHGVTPSLIDLIRQLLAVSPGERPTTRDILDHRWVQMLSNIAVSEQRHDKSDGPQTTSRTITNGEHLSSETDADNDPSAEWSTGFFTEKISQQSHLDIETAVGSSGHSAPGSTGVSKASLSPLSMHDAVEIDMPFVRETLGVDIHVVPKAPVPTARLWTRRELAIYLSSPAVAAVNLLLHVIQEAKATRIVRQVGFDLDTTHGRRVFLILRRPAADHMIQRTDRAYMMIT